MILGTGRKISCLFETVLSESMAATAASSLLGSLMDDGIGL
jgi:hypothetical protein